MRGIICYDLSDNKLRTRLVKILSKYGSRIQYSVFQFHLDKVTWKKLISILEEKEFINGIHNIIIIPVSEADHAKIVNLGQVFIPFDYETVIYSAFGIDGISNRDYQGKAKKKKKLQSQDVINKLFNDDIIKDFDK
jgi:CRISPR-associated protein Cas2